MRVPFIDLNAQHTELKQEISQALNEVIQSSSFIMGPHVRTFEESFGKYLGDNAKAIGVASGTDALLLSLMALDIGPGDQVITSPWTFFATAGCIIRTGATPIFCDIDPSTGNITAESVKSAITPATKAIIPVHIYGRMAPMKDLCSLAREHNLFIIEDACQAAGARLNTEECNETETSEKSLAAGLWGDTGCFSLFPTKNLGVMGDGGIVVTRDEKIADRIKLLRVHGARPKYHHISIGINSRLDALQAAIASVKLPYLNKWNQQRREAVSLYRNLLSDLEEHVTLLKEESFSESDVHHQFVIKINKRDQAMKFLKDSGIDCGVYYPEPLHKQPCFAFRNVMEEKLPVAEKLCSSILSLPVFPGIKNEQIEFVCQKLKEFCEL